jgi:hypothetical protein
MTDEKHAEPSAAAVAEPVFNPADQYTWSPEQREHWNETGEIPEPPKKQEPEPAAPPAKEEESEPKGKTAAEPETAPSQRKKDRKPGEKLNAEERIAQLTAEVRELKERERSREAAPKAAPAAEPAKQPEAPKRPNPYTWKGTPEEYEAAVDTYEKHQKELVIQEFQRNGAAEVQRQRLQAQFDEAKTKYPESEAKIKESLKTLFFTPETKLPGVILNMFNDSECLVDLMYVLGDTTTRSNFIETAQKNPGKAIRALVQMEADVMAKRSAPAPEEKRDSKSSEEPKPRAPKPPSEVGGRAAAGEDALRAAAEANDFATFEKEQSRRKFAKN